MAQPIWPADKVTAISEAQKYLLRAEELLDIEGNIPGQAEKVGQAAACAQISEALIHYAIFLQGEPP